MNDTQTRRIRVVENLGWLDRGIRLVIGTALVVVPLTIITVNVPRIDLGVASLSGWLYVSILVAVYPFLTAALGWDPVYRLFNVRSCGGSERNPCGTLPYELDAAVGDHPIPDSTIEHSLRTAHHSRDRR